MVHRLQPALGDVAKIMQVSTRTELMRHSDLVDFEPGGGEKCRQHRSVGEAFQRSSGSKDAEQDGAINFVRVLTGSD
jgi:hypothetical protein